MKEEGYIVSEDWAKVFEPAGVEYDGVMDDNFEQAEKFVKDNEEAIEQVMKDSIKDPMENITSDLQRGFRGERYDTIEAFKDSAESRDEKFASFFAKAFELEGEEVKDYFQKLKEMERKLKDAVSDEDRELDNYENTSLYRQADRAELDRLGTIVENLREQLEDMILTKAQLTKTQPNV